MRNSAPKTATRVVDKMPDNLNHLGLIAVLLPEARVILCRRDPRDIALSCWQTGFRACPWNNDSGLYHPTACGLYGARSGHWQKHSPLATFDLSYEALVADLERHARLVIDFVGLDWDPACLSLVGKPPGRANAKSCAGSATHPCAVGGPMATLRGESKADVRGLRTPWSRAG